MKDQEYYTNVPVKYPSKKDYETTYYYKNGKLVGKFPDVLDSKDYSVKEVLLDDVAYRQALIDYTKASSLLHQEFRDDLLEHLGITDHPKAGLLFDKAWERGHSDGLYYVVQVAEDLVELLD